jgi:hypothetical protein
MKSLLFLFFLLRGMRPSELTILIYLACLSIIYALYIWFYSAAGLLGSKRGGPLWLVTCVIFSPQCATLLTGASLFTIMPRGGAYLDLLGPVSAQCAGAAVARLEWTYRHSWFNSDITAGFGWTLLWATMWTCVRFIVQRTFARFRRHRHEDDVNSKAVQKKLP